jgi:hypothetical protein
MVKNQANQTALLRRGGTSGHFIVGQSCLEDLINCTLVAISGEKASKRKEAKKRGKNFISKQSLYLFTRRKIVIYWPKMSP